MVRSWKVESCEGIGDHVRKDEQIIDEIEVHMTKSQEMMKKTINSLDRMLNSKAGNIIFYTIMFAILLFMILYKLT